MGLICERKQGLNDNQALTLDSGKRLIIGLILPINGNSGSQPAGDMLTQLYSRLLQLFRVFIVMWCA